MVRSSVKIEKLDRQIPELLKIRINPPTIRTGKESLPPPVEGLIWRYLSDSMKAYWNLEYNPQEFIETSTPAITSYSSII